MSDWQALRPKDTCLICGHRGWCTVSPNGDLIRCMRVESARPSVGSDGQTGWLHPIPDNAPARPVAPMAPRQKVPKKSHAEWQLVWKQQRSALNPQRLARFAASLGVSVKALEAYGVGWDGRMGCFSWPMYDGRRRIVGVRVRKEDGSYQACVPGSSNGLFIPDGLDFHPLPSDVGLSDTFPLILAMPEGPTDAAAAWDLDVTAVGRPNSSSGLLMMQELLSSSPHKQAVVVVGENDGPIWPKVPNAVPLFPGIAGALSFARGLLEYAGSVKLLFPPRPIKDFRDWKNAGATAADVLTAVHKAKYMNADRLTFLEGKLEERKRQAMAQRRAAA